jgi:hypothetical protein
MNRLTIPASALRAGDRLVTDPERPATIVEVIDEGPPVAIIRLNTTGAPIYVGRNSEQVIEVVDVDDDAYLSPYAARLLVAGIARQSAARIAADAERADELGAYEAHRAEAAR